MRRRTHLLLHRLLRRALPARIRRLRGLEMEGTFLRLLDDAEQRHGLGGALVAWRREAPDLLRTALRLRWRRAGPSRAPDPELPRKRASMIDHVLHDLRVIGRGLAREPGWTTAAVLTLALAIGATTAIFSVVDAVLLEPLPYSEPDRLLAVGAYDVANQRGQIEVGVSYPIYDAFRTSQEPLEELAAYRHSEMTVLIDGAGDRVSGAAATASLFRTLRASPLVGRLYRDEHDVENGPAAVLLSHDFWQRRFGSEVDVVGETLVVDEAAYEIVGVMPPDFAFPDREAEFWLSMSQQTRYPYSFYLKMLGRVRDDIGTEQAIDRLRALAVDVPDNVNAAPEGYSGLAMPLHDAVVANVEEQLLIFMAAVSAVLLIACINVVNLALSRAAGRGKEHSIRAALGATRGRLVQQLLTESMLLSIAGGALGLLLAAVLTDTLVRLSPVSVPRQEEIALDGGILLFTGLLALAIGALIGIIAALRAGSANLCGGLREGSRGVSDGYALQRLRKGLIVAQVAVAVVLLFAAGLLVQTLAGLLDIDRGYDADEILTLSTSLPTAAYPDFVTRAALYDRVLERVDGLPGVESSALSDLLPYHGQYLYGMRIEGYEAEEGEEMMAESLVVTPEFFATMKIPPQSGRLFSERDGGDVVVINETMARTYWPAGDALGARVTLGPNAPATVVGIVNDTRYTRLVDEDRAQAYIPYLSGDTRDMMLFVRSGGDPRDLIVAIREIFAATDREIVVADIMTIGERLWETTSWQRFRAMLVGVFGATALLLAVVGVYGVIAYNVGQRTRELGIRKALGADGGAILRRVVGGGLALVAIGVLVGAAGCWYVATVLEAYLFGVAAHDPWAFAAATLALGVAALIAAWIPGRRAAAVDPLVALRAE